MSENQEQPASTRVIPGCDAHRPIGETGWTPSFACMVSTDHPPFCMIGIINDAAQIGPIMEEIKVLLLRHGLSEEAEMVAARMQHTEKVNILKPARVVPR